jgi:hypothetical protein
MFLWLLRRLPGWNSIHIAEKTHDRIGFYGRVSLALMFCCEFLAWKFLKPHHWLEFSGIMALGLLFVLEQIAWIYSKRLDELRRAESTEKDKKHQDELAQLRADAAESAMTTEFVRPRSLSEEVRAKLKETLSKYRGQKFKVFWKRENPESVVFGKEIRQFLATDCEWDTEIIYIGTEELNTLDHVPVGQGVCVVASWQDIAEHRANRQSTIPLREELSQLFKDVGIGTFPLGAKTISSLTLGVLGIIIGVNAR